MTVVTLQGIGKKRGREWRQRNGLVREDHTTVVVREGVTVVRRKINLEGEVT